MFLTDNLETIHRFSETDCSDNMKKMINLLILYLLIVSCSKTILNNNEKNSNETLRPTENILPEYQENIEKNALPMVIKELKSVDKRFETVINYGKWLENNRGKDADSLTIHSDSYWNAFITMSMDNPNVYFTRLFLLIIDGELTRTDYVRLFTSWHCDFKRESNRTVLEIIDGWQKQIKKNSNTWVQKGVAEYDKGNQKTAMEHYKKAITIWPKNSWAHYEMGLTMMMDDVKEIMEETRSCDEYFKIARKYDPFQRFAYQGKKEIAQGMPVIMDEIEPSLKRMTSANVTKEDMKQFADGCVKLKEYELAAYAYHFLLSMTMNRDEGFAIGTLQNFKSCIENLGALKAAREIEEQYLKYNKLIKEKNTADG